MTMCTLLCFIAWWQAVGTTDPTSSGFLAFLFFYTTLFLALLGLFTVVGFAVRVWILHQEDVVFRNVRKTFRQGFLFATLVCGALFLKSQGLFKVWVVALLLLLLVCVEFFFISYTHSARRPRPGV
jgi:hypothetical protein